ncbi:hypothetical protein [Franconibacter helveticus]|uniref:hypothetical protein n=1 Tax=Franconibacter helveticus TaxID=357240 RepID=UPI002908E484|nr:hypothetical protein [Franconibacter helveticus]MDU6923493.1 hypothetical protein [Franconibacter helveticus]
MFFARYPQPVITPTLYAEDGVWLGNAISNGWLHTFLHARPDYFVFFNIFFLFLAALLSKIFSGSVLMLLPLFVATLSYAFYSFTSTIIFWTVKRHANYMLACAAFCFSIFIPLGVSQAESIGTLVQIGFYMPILSICLHLFRTDASSVKKGLCDVGIFLMAATNPVCFAITGMYFIINFFREADKKRFVLSLIPLSIALLILFAIIVPRMNGSGGIAGVSYNPAHLIEMVSARAVLYPFVFSFYSKLNDVISVGLVIMYIGIVLVAYMRSEPKTKAAILFLLAMLIIYDAATVAGRSAITGLLTGYGSTYPDRYFMGINIISVTLITICLYQIKIPALKYAFLAVMLVLYISKMHTFFESSSDKRRIALDYIYTNALCNAKDEGNGFKQIMILPSPDWYIRVPAGYIDTLGCVRN